MTIFFASAHCFFNETCTIIWHLENLKSQKHPCLPAVYRQLNLLEADADWAVLMGNSRCAGFPDRLLVSKEALLHGNNIICISWDPKFHTPCMPYDPPKSSMLLKNASTGNRHGKDSTPIYLGHSRLDSIIFILTSLIFLFHLFFVGCKFENGSIKFGSPSCFFRLNFTSWINDHLIAFLRYVRAEIDIGKICIFKERHYYFWFIF